MDRNKYFPRRLSFRKLCEVLVGYLNSGADKQYIGVGDVVQKSRVSLHNISRNNNFFKSWNFVKESEQEKGKYLLNREAAEFAFAYRIDPYGKHTKEMLRKFLSKDEVLSDFIYRIKREGFNRESVIVELPLIIGDLRADKVGLNAFADMIFYAFQIRQLSSSSITVRESRETRVAEPDRKLIDGTYPIIPPISINIMVNSEVTPDKLKAYVKALFEAYKEYNKRT